MNRCLAELKVGERARVRGFKSGCMAYQLRLLAMGVVPEAELTILRVAPLGDPIQLKIQNFSICLRRKEADILELERVGCVASMPE